MPWYWTDEVASILQSKGEIDADLAAALAAMPVALRSDRDNIEEAAHELLDDGEIPLAA
jgi:hypothetical protein